MNILQTIQGLFSSALQPLTEQHAEFAELVRPAQEARFGDYQANCAMPLKKVLGGNPRDIAQKIIDALPRRDIFQTIEIAGPGFINLRLTNAFLCAQLEASRHDPRRGIEPITPAPTLIVDYSSPNVAKPMHVGHLRSTIIGDAIARIYRALGWKVIADNHLGDWGTQFGMLIYGWRNLKDPVLAEKDPLAELARLYRLVNQKSEADPMIAEAARQETAKLHQGDQDNLTLWNQFMPWCLADLSKIYDRLGIRFDLQQGESFYHPLLQSTVDKLQAAGLAQLSDGAICVFFPDPTGAGDDEGKPKMLLPPTIIRKSDGAFSYATSDIACIVQREAKHQPQLVVYVVDDRQSLHFEQVFETARRLHATSARLVHVSFGKITDPSGKPFKTREGGTISLMGLLDEAAERARKVVDENSGHLPEADRAEIAECVGVGAVKYADLSQNRISDYVFDWDKMISLQGNTATYLQYAYARTQGIFRKGDIDQAELGQRSIAMTVDHPSERALALCLLQLPEAVAAAAADFRPNLVANYLFELANAFTAFFRDCPVLKAATDAERDRRLLLCEQTARHLAFGLDLLGIESLDRM